MIEEILPSHVASATVFGDEDTGGLWPSEALLMSRAVDSRVREFANGRSCARRALSKIGIKAGPILVGPQREPLWPQGITGSITHCPGYCAAAVALHEETLALGIDAEIDAPLPEGVLSLIASEREATWLAGRCDATSWGRLLFSAKESVYKALFPLMRRWLDFKEVEINFAPAEQSFHAVVLSGANTGHIDLTHLHGRYLRREGIILTAIMYPPPA